MSQMNPVAEEGPPIPPNATVVTSFSVTRPMRTVASAMAEIEARAREEVECVNPAQPTAPPPVRLPTGYPPAGHTIQRPSTAQTITRPTTPQSNRPTTSHTITRPPTSQSARPHSVLSEFRSMSSYGNYALDQTFHTARDSIDDDTECAVDTADLEAHPPVSTVRKLFQCVCKHKIATIVFVVIVAGLIALIAAVAIGRH